MIKIPKDYKVTIDGGYLQIVGEIKQEDGIIKVDKIVYSEEKPKENHENN